MSVVFWHEHTFAFLCKVCKVAHTNICIRLLFTMKSLEIVKGTIKHLVSCQKSGII